MSNLQLHVHPTYREAIVHSLRDGGRNHHAPLGTSLMGVRAQMLYIHGSPTQWAYPGARDWLRKSAMTRLEDDNPARVVWCNDA
jgi:hypothetical protein